MFLRQSRSKLQIFSCAFKGLITDKILNNNKYSYQNKPTKENKETMGQSVLDRYDVTFCSDRHTDSSDFLAIKTSASHTISSPSPSKARCAFRLPFNFTALSRRTSLQIKVWLKCVCSLQRSAFLPMCVRSAFTCSSIQSTESTLFSMSVALAAALDTHKVSNETYSFNLSFSPSRSFCSLWN